MTKALASRTILIADDHRLFAEGVAAILRDHQCHVVIVTELAKVLSVISATRPDLLVLDLAFGGESAMPLLRHLRTKVKRLPILVISASEESVIVERVLETGAAYVPKSKAGVDVAEVAASLVDGTYKPPKPKQRRTGSIASTTIGTIKLSRAQIEVLRDVQLGKTNLEIGQQTGRAIKTIEAHLSEIYARTGFTTRGALMRWATEHAKELNINL